MTRPTERGIRSVRTRRLFRYALFGAALTALPSGTCVDMTTRIAINSFLHGVTPVLADRIEADLTAAADDESP